MLKMPDDMIQGSHEWLEIRKKCITATDMAAIMGVSPWKTPYQLFEEKLGYRIIEENEAMREGSRLEPYARAKLQELFQVELNPKVCFHPLHSWMMASLDAIDDKKKFLTEIKCSKKYHEQAKEGKAPAHVYTQLQWQMHVAGAPHGFYYAFDGYTGTLIPVQRDDVYIEKMIVKAKEFYECLNSLEPPSLIDRDIVTREDREWCSLAHQWKEAKRNLEIWKALEEKMRKQLIQEAGDSCVQGSGIKLTRYLCRGRIDYDSVISLYCPNVNIEIHRKPNSIAWRITS